MNDIAKWQERWQTGQTAWDTGGPQRLLMQLVDEAKAWRLLAPGARILEPGAGRAHNGAALARQGFQVTSFDLVPEAVAAAKAAYGDVLNLTITAGDALHANPLWKGAFDAIFDRAMLCALPPELRRDYVQTCWEHLAPGGAFLSILFTEVFHADGRLGPPYQISLKELSHLMAPYFALQTAEEFANPDKDDKIRREALAVFRRRDRVLVESAP